MSTLTMLQKDTMRRGTIGQLDRSETSVITLRIRGYGSPMELQTYVQTALQSAEDVVQINPIEAIAPGDYHNLRRRYDELQLRLQSLEEDFQESVNNQVAELVGDVPDDEPEIEYLTVDDVVRRTGINYHTATRYLRDGWWHGEKVRNQWRIPANQAFARKR